MTTHVFKGVTQEQSSKGITSMLMYFLGGSVLVLGLVGALVFLGPAKATDNTVTMLYSQPQDQTPPNEVGYPSLKGTICSTAQGVVEIEAGKVYAEYKLRAENGDATLKVGNSKDNLPYEVLVPFGSQNTPSPLGDLQIANDSCATFWGK